MILYYIVPIKLYNLIDNNYFYYLRSSVYIIHMDLKEQYKKRISQKICFLIALVIALIVITII